MLFTVIHSDSQMWYFIHCPVHPSSHSSDYLLGRACNTFMMLTNDLLPAPEIVIVCFVCIGALLHQQGSASNQAPKIVNKDLFTAPEIVIVCLF